MKTPFFRFFTQTAGVCMAALCALMAASQATAQQAYASARTTLRAGPDRGYPQVGWIGIGAAVYVNGCVRGYHWCDVTAGQIRGWANARHLSYLYQNRRVAIYGTGYGFPVVAFALGSYWDSHYRGQSWYDHRPYWNSWRPGQPQPPQHIPYSHHPRADFHAARPPRAPVYVAPVTPGPHVYHAPPGRHHQAQHPPVRHADAQFARPPQQQRQPPPRSVQERGMGSAPVGMQR